MASKSQRQVLDEKEQPFDTSASSTTQSAVDLSGSTPIGTDTDIELVVSEKALSFHQTFPDGGREAWIVVLGSWCCVFVSFGWIVCIGSFQSHYQTHQLASYPPSTVAWIPSTEVAMMFFGSPFWGILFDKYGPRILLILGTLMHVFGLMMTSLATQYYQFLLAQSICSGLGASAIFLAANNSVGTWFLHKRGLAFGIVTSGSSFAGALLPVMINQLIPRIGFPWTIRTIAFIFLALSLIALSTVKSRIPPHPTPPTLRKFLSPLHEPPFLLMTLSSFFFFWGLFIPFNFLPLQALHNPTLPPTLPPLLITILNASSLPGRLIPPALADHFGRINMTILTTLLCTLLTLSLWIPATSTASILAYTVLYGIFSGSYVSLSPSVMAQLSPDVRELGSRMGLSMAFIGIAVLTGNPVAGALVERGGGLYVSAGVGGGVYGDGDGGVCGDEGLFAGG